MSPSTIPSVLLTSHNSATEDDFYDWVNYVINNIEDACGFLIDVDCTVYQDPAAREDTIYHATDAERVAIQDALRVMRDKGLWRITATNDATR